VYDDALRRSMWPKGESVRRSRDGIKDPSRNLLNLYGIGQDVCLDLASLPHTYTSIKSTECVDLDFWMVTTVRAMLRCSTGGCNGMHFFAVALVQPLDSNMMEVSAEFPIVLKLALVPVRHMHE